MQHFNVPVKNKNLYQTTLKKKSQIIQHFLSSNADKDLIKRCNVRLITRGENKRLLTNFIFSSRKLENLEQLDAIYVKNFVKMKAYVAKQNSYADDDPDINDTLTSSDKPMTMAQHLKSIKDKGYKVVKNPSGSITITKIKAAAKK